MAATVVLLSDSGAPKVGLVNSATLLTRHTKDQDNIKEKTDSIAGKLAKKTTQTTTTKMPSECKENLAEHEITEFPQYANKDCEPEMNCHKSPLGVVGLFRQNLCEVLHHHYFQIIICVLVLLDTAVVVTEIMVESSQAKSDSEHLKTAEFVLHYVSLSILSIFMFEITLKIFAMGTDFLKHKFEIFDAVVVTVSFFLDVFLSSGGLKDGVEFLVLLRLWRITRIINGIIMSIKSQSKEKVVKISNQLVEVNAENEQLIGTVQKHQEEIDKLRDAITQLGYDPDKLIH